jgi:hypothetical protein
MGTYYCFRDHHGCDHIVVITEFTGVNFFSQKFTGPGPRIKSTKNLLVLENFLLILNIGMEEMKFVEHKIDLSPPPSL